MANRLKTISNKNLYGNVYSHHSGREILIRRREVEREREREREREPWRGGGKNDANII